MFVHGISPAHLQVPEQVPTTPLSPTGDQAFSQVLDNAIGGVDQLQHEADDALRLLASGESADLHGAMIALEQADIALRTTVNIRDRVVTAYEQIMNMAV